MRYLVDRYIGCDLEQAVSLAHLSRSSYQLHAEQWLPAQRLANRVGLVEDLVGAFDIGDTAMPEGNNDGYVFHKPNLAKFPVVINTRNCRPHTPSHWFPALKFVLQYDHSMTVEIFKTSVQDDALASEVIQLLFSQLPQCRINFDLADQDGILRIEGTGFTAGQVVQLVSGRGISCIRLD